jgi:hypothetical protein
MLTIRDFGLTEQRLQNPRSYFQKVSKGDFLSQFTREYRRIDGTIKVTYREKTIECLTIFDFFQRFCVLADISADIFRVEGNKIPYYVGSLTLRNYLEMQACLLEGAYHSAARSLRWLFEMNVVGATACVNPSLLDEQFGSKAPTDQEEFERLLERCDTEEITIGRGKRKRIFGEFSLPSEDLSLLYADLCKYVHLSKISFDKSLTWPNLQYIPEKFDEVFHFALRTIDLVLWMESKMCLCFDKGTTQALRYFLKNHDGLNQFIPITIKLISSLN